MPSLSGGSPQTGSLTRGPSRPAAVPLVGEHLQPPPSIQETPRQRLLLDHLRIPHHRRPRQHSPARAGQLHPDAALVGGSVVDPSRPGSTAGRPSGCLPAEGDRMHGQGQQVAAHPAVAGGGCWPRPVGTGGRARGPVGHRRARPRRRRPPGQGRAAGRPGRPPVERPAPGRPPGQPGRGRARPRPAGRRRRLARAGRRVAGRPGRPGPSRPSPRPAGPSGGGPRRHPRPAPGPPGPGDRRRRRPQPAPHRPARRRQDHAGQAPPWPAPTAGAGRGARGHPGVLRRRAPRPWRRPHRGPAVPRPPPRHLGPRPGRRGPGAPTRRGLPRPGRNSL